MKTINIKGKDYVQVDERLRIFREEHPNWCIETDIVNFNQEEVLMKTYIRDEKGNLIGTGIAHEVVSSSTINKTSMYENCETSAVGRAIAIATNIGNIGSICSADEVDLAIKQQNEIESSKPEKTKEITIEDAKMRKTTQGKYYYELKDKNLEYIIANSKIEESRICAEMVLKDRQSLLSDCIEIEDEKDLPF